MKMMWYHTTTSWLFHNAERVAVYDAGDVVIYITNTHYKECGKDFIGIRK